MAKSRTGAKLNKTSFWDYVIAYWILHNSSYKLFYYDSFQPTKVDSELQSKQSKLGTRTTLMYAECQYWLYDTELIYQKYSFKKKYVFDLLMESKDVHTNLNHVYLLSLWKNLSYNLQGTCLLAGNSTT